MNIGEHAGREELLRIIEELERKTLRLEEELETVTNELNAANEELNQTNEELLATNEELQAINEELIESQQELLDRNTRLERSNTELVEARLLLHATFNQNPLPMMIASLPEQKVLHYNRETRVLFDIVDEPDFTGREIGQVSRSWKFADSEGHVLEPDVYPMARVLGGETLDDEELRVIRRDGSVRWVLANGNRILGGDGAPVAAILTFADITERKEQERSLSMLRHALDHTNQIVVRFDNRGQVSYANREAVRLLKGTLLDGNGVELFPGIHPDKWRQILHILPSERYYHIHSIEQETTSGSISRFLSEPF
jgi:PAS domain-containing protein